jgi:hypothetical protein
MLFAILAANRLALNLEKCVFAVAELDFLSFPRRAVIQQQAGHHYSKKLSKTEAPLTGSSSPPSQVSNISASAWRADPPALDRPQAFDFRPQERLATDLSHSPAAVTAGYR